MVNSRDGGKRIQKLKLSLVYSTLWMKLKAHNAIVFRNERRLVMLIEDDIRINTLSCIKNKSKLFKIDWSVWCMSLILNFILQYGMSYSLESLLFCANIFFHRSNIVPFDLLFLRLGQCYYRRDHVHIYSNDPIYIQG